MAFGFFDYNRRINQLDPRKVPIQPDDWRRKSQETDMSEKEIRDHFYDVNWKAISNRQNLTEEFIREFDEELNWRAISNSQELSKDFIREHADKLNWCGLLQHFKFDVEFLDEMSKHFNAPVIWENIMEYQKLDYHFIDKYADQLLNNVTSAMNLYGKQRLSEDFMRLWKNKVNWVMIIKTQKLSEQFLEEMFASKEPHIWNFKHYIFKYQKHLSYNFKRKYMKKGERS